MSAVSVPDGVLRGAPSQPLRLAAGAGWTPRLVSPVFCEITGLTAAMVELLSQNTVEIEVRLRATTPHPRCALDPDLDLPPGLSTARTSAADVQVEAARTDLPIRRRCPRAMMIT